MCLCCVPEAAVALFVLSPLLRGGMPTVAPECGCHCALGSMRFRMFHLISLTSPVRQGGSQASKQQQQQQQQQQLREPWHPVAEQSWLTHSLPEGPCVPSPRPGVWACKTMRNPSADRDAKLQSLQMTTVPERERERDGDRLGLGPSANSLLEEMEVPELSLRSTS